MQREYQKLVSAVADPESTRTTDLKLEKKRIYKREGLGSIAALLEVLAICLLLPFSVKPRITNLQFLLFPRKFSSLSIRFRISVACPEANTEGSG